MVITMMKRKKLHAISVTFLPSFHWTWFARCASKWGREAKQVQCILLLPPFSVGTGEQWLDQGSNNSRKGGSVFVFFTLSQRFIPPHHQGGTKTTGVGMPPRRRTNHTLCCTTHLTFPTTPEKRLVGPQRSVSGEMLYNMGWQVDGMWDTLS